MSFSTQELVIGRRAVLETLRSGREINAIHIAKDSHGGSIGEIKKVSRKHGVIIKEVSQKQLNELAEGENHQGVIAYVSPYQYKTIEDILQVAQDKNEAPFIILCDEIEDPHNLGAIIRSAESAGVHGIILPKRRSAAITHTVANISAGAIEHMAIARVTNLVTTIEHLQKQNVWIYGADMDGTSYNKLDFRTGGIGLVIGSEGKGIGRLVREKCDFIVSIPMYGKINSLNASVAAGILMFEVAKQRKECV